MKDIIRCKLIYWMSLAVLGLVSYGVGQLAVMLYYPFKTIDVKEPIKVLNENKSLSRGSHLVLSFEYHKYVDTDAEVIYQLYNKDIKHYVTLATIKSNVSVGKGIAVTSIYIPDTVVVGKYALIATSKYKVNEFRTICRRFVSEEFNVVGS